ncbi:MAG TPA: hypothetical protein VEB69_06310 [Acidimicrobiia bacterium]|nr:hypothetical protein [Acidimicrobiia bacterium]
MSWVGAGIRALLILFYFATATVWLPSALLRTEPVATASRFWADLIALLAWGIPFVFGLWGLRTLQRRGWI